ncbi:T-cell surface glycoprotein CD3 epsilon chain-like [Kryptolebias marmoratus]|uniref:T-cell surface glycoprotein CD3 epsilon chain-like n=1 Tax=Kryptolebias marmoratus TaxID=37003 RepID=UPI0007F8B449|nr:T-cell surface glycoprotein CD3 epsilon chain-like [Kryptolebias marmoratus]
MHQIGVQVVLIVVLMFEASAQGEATFWRKQVTLTCPEEGQWFNDGKEVNTNILQTYEFEYQQQAEYSCVYSDNKKYYFFVKGRACENCFEVDGRLFMLAIIVDLIGTSVLMMVVYSCTKKKVPDRPSQSRSARGGRASSAPSADYEQLNRGAEGTETYSAVVVRRT